MTDVGDSDEADEETLRAQELEQLGIPLHATVLIQGLRGAKHLNGILGQVIGWHETSNRFMVQVAPASKNTKREKDSVRIKRENILYPARCPGCDAEVLRAGCFSCGEHMLFGCTTAEELIKSDRTQEDSSQ